MSASLKDLTVGEFLDWERRQPDRYEFDGVQPVAMTGGSFGSAIVARELIFALRQRLPADCQPFQDNIKVVTRTRVRYPDAMVVCGPVDRAADTGDPTVVFEILSPSTELTDRRVKPIDYASVPSIQVYVILPQDRIAATVLRRSAGWVEQEIKGADAVLSLPEIGVSFPLGLLQQAGA